MVEKQYEDRRHVDQPLECELQGEDLNGEGYKVVRVKGLTGAWARKNNVFSGDSTIFTPDGAVIDDTTDQLLLPPGATIEVSGRTYIAWLDA